MSLIGGQSKIDMDDNETINKKDFDIMNKKNKGMAMGGKVKAKGMAMGGKVKAKGMAMGGKIKSKGYAMGGAVGSKGAAVGGAGFGAARFSGRGTQIF